MGQKINIRQVQIICFVNIVLNWEKIILLQFIIFENEKRVMFILDLKKSLPYTQL